MDFTLEDWEDLESELGQRDLFWDATLNNYQDLFSFSKCHPVGGPTHCPALCQVPTGCCPGTWAGSAVIWCTVHRRPALVPAWLPASSCPFLLVLVEPLLQHPVRPSPTQLSPVRTQSSLSQDSPVAPNIV